MSNCPPNWPSDYTYTGLLRASSGAIANSKLVADPNQQTVAVGQEMFIISGAISVGERAGQIDSIYTIKSSVATAIPNVGTYAIKFENASGQSLGSYSFEPRWSSDGANSPFTLVLPSNPGIARIVLLHNGQELSVKIASNHAPTVTVTAPIGGELLAGLAATLRWTAQDIDGDPLIYAVQYSIDGGATWQTLVSGWPNTTFDVNLSAISGTNRGLFRVLASDGFLTAQDQSKAVFSVTKHAPQVSIRTPGDTEYAEDQTIMLEGSASDNEDGSLGDPSLSWSSNVNGILGKGKSLAISASTLSEGTHTIVLTANDSDSSTSSAIITIRVSHKGPPKITTASISGKRLLVNGVSFDDGAKILLDGEVQKKTVNDEQNATTILIGNKAGKLISPGQTVVLTVRNSDGSLSNGFSFTRPQ